MRQTRINRPSVKNAHISKYGGRVWLNCNTKGKCPKTLANPKGHSGREGGVSPQSAARSTQRGVSVHHQMAAPYTARGKTKKIRNPDTSLHESV
jgi:hypothetical protein